MTSKTSSGRKTPKQRTKNSAFERCVPLALYSARILRVFFECRTAEFRMSKRSPDRALEPAAVCGGDGRVPLGRKQKAPGQYVYGKFPSDGGRCADGAGPTRGHRACSPSTHEAACAGGGLCAGGTGRGPAFPSSRLRSGGRAQCKGRPALPTASLDECVPPRPPKIRRLDIGRTTYRMTSLRRLGRS